MRHRHLILGGLPNEKHIIDYVNDNENLGVHVICVNLENGLKPDIDNKLSQKKFKSKTDSDKLFQKKFKSKTDSDDTDEVSGCNADLEIGDFNDPIFWKYLYSKYGKTVSRIIFDSSTSKFIKSNGLWNMEHGLNEIRALLTDGGEIYFDAIESGTVSYPRTFFQDLQNSGNTLATITMLPLISDHSVTMNVSADDIKRGISLANFLFSRGYLLYVTNLDRVARETGFSIQILMDNYPIRKTTYPISNYLKWGTDVPHNLSLIHI